MVSNVQFTHYTGTVTGKDYCTNFTYDYTVSVPQFADVSEFAVITATGLRMSSRTSSWKN